MAWSGAQRQARLRVRQAERLRQLLFKLQDAEAQLARRDEVIRELLWELRHRARKELFQSWIDAPEEPN
jgi:hypothetical protein